MNDDCISRTKANVIIKWLEHEFEEEWHFLEYVMREFNEIPSADVVEVVRCKDCRWGTESCGIIECSADLNATTEYHGYYWFCPNGERRDADAEE